MLFYVTRRNVIAAIAYNVDSNRASRWDKLSLLRSTTIAPNSTLSAYTITDTSCGIMFQAPDSYALTVKVVTLQTSTPTRNVIRVMPDNNIIELSSLSGSNKADHDILPGSSLVASPIWYETGAGQYHAPNVTRLFYQQRVGTVMSALYEIPSYKLISST